MELLERFARGDQDAFETLFRQFQGEVFSWIVRIVRDRGIAEDLTVEAFWKMHQAHARFDPARSFGAWARRIATNLALDHWRTGRRETPLVGEPVDGEKENPGIQRETREQIEAAFKRLSPKLRIVATLSLVEEVRHRELAEALGISEATVRVRLFRATRILRKELEQLGGQHVNEINEIKLRELLKNGLVPADRELRRDLWPEMVRRMEKGEKRVPWFDWVLLAAATAGLLLAPQMIPMLLYHL